MVTITIGGADKSGALARYRLSCRKGYPLKGQQIADSASGAKLVRITSTYPRSIGPGSGRDQELQSGVRPVGIDGLQSGSAVVSGNLPLSLDVDRPDWSRRYPPGVLR